MIKTLKLKCHCGCLSKIKFSDFLDRQIAVDVKNDIEKDWHGVVISLDDLPRLIKFLEQWKGR